MISYISTKLMQNDQTLWIGKYPFMSSVIINLYPSLFQLAISSWKSIMKAVRGNTIPFVLDKYVRCWA